MNINHEVLLVAVAIRDSVKCTEKYPYTPHESLYASIHKGEELIIDKYQTIFNQRRDGDTKRIWFSQKHTDSFYRDDFIYYKKVLIPFYTVVDINKEMI